MQKKQAGTTVVTLLESNIISSKFEGSFNDTTALIYVNSVKKIIADLNQQPFAMLIDDLLLEGGTPEAYEHLNAYNSWLKGQALVAKAMIINNNVHKQIILQRSPSLLEQNIAFFTSPSEAQVWLREELATYNDKSAK